MASRIVRVSLLVLVAVAASVSLVLLDGSARASAGDEANSPSLLRTPGLSAAQGAIAQVALQDLGQREGQCILWVRRVVEEATGRQLGFGYRDGYLEGGAYEVSLTDARSGDIIQLADDSDTSPGVDYPGLHTAIVLENLGAGRFDIIDSNSKWDGIVRIREDYRPLEAAARYAGISVRVYRIPGGSATADISTSETADDAPPIAPGVRVVVRADGDCLNLRAAPGLSASKLTCLPENSQATVTGAPIKADGYRWLPLVTETHSGWAADIYLQPLGDADANTESTNVTTSEQPSTPLTGFVLPTPPLGALTQGLAGTSDPAALAAAQPFEAESIAFFDVTSQRFLVYVVGAPQWVQTLTAEFLRPDSVVTIRRSAVAAAPAARVLTTLSYYYCEQGSIQQSIGDGGGFCGAMANGKTVHAGAAACAPEYLGQRFRIEGDPDARTYTCEDTGAAVAGEHRDIWFNLSDDGWLWFQAVGASAYIVIEN